MTRRGFPVAVALFAVALAGCTTSAAPQASSADTGTSSTTSAAPQASSADTATSGTAGPASPAAGDFDGPVDVGGGRHLYVTCRGSGSPTVVLESGYHDSSSLWSESEPVPPAVGPSVMDGLAAHHRVCAYDRPGTLDYDPNPPSVTTRSSPVPMPRTAADIAVDLHTMLANAGLATPVVLVGHSMGGFMSLVYTRTYPTDVAALVLVDAFAPDLPALFGADWPTYRDVLNGAGGTADPNYETLDVDASLTELNALAALPQLPYVVLSKTEPFPLPDGTPEVVRTKLDPLWNEGQASLVTLLPNTPHLVATGSDHYIYVRQPDLVVGAVELAIGRLAG